jgi:hypothetical protein
VTGGLGDIAIGDKHVLYSHLNDNPDGPLYESNRTHDASSVFAFYTAA